MSQMFNEKGKFIVYEKPIVKHYPHCECGKKIAEWKDKIFWNKLKMCEDCFNSLPEEDKKLVK